MPVQIDELRAQAAPAGTPPRSDVFLKIVTKRSRIKGEATTLGHADDIEVSGWSWGVAANTAIGSGQATARRAYRQLVVLKGIDTASTGLMAALSSNDEVREARLTMRKAGGEALDYFTMTLANARVVGLDLEVGSDGRPVERLTLAFTKVEIVYQPQRDGGAAGGAFSFSDEVMPAA